MPVLETLEHFDQARAWQGHIPLENLYTVGIAGERFLRALKDEGKIYGTRCAKCNVTYVPARLYCERCFAHLDDKAWVLVGPGGALESYTVLHLAPDGSALERPRLMGLVKLDGADSVWPADLGEVDQTALRIGMRVTAVLRPKAERVGAITDLAYFRPA